jgi:hypothetical protein
VRIPLVQRESKREIPVETGFQSQSEETPDAATPYTLLPPRRTVSLPVQYCKRATQRLSRSLQTDDSCAGLAPCHRMPRVPIARSWTDSLMNEQAH